MSNLKELNSAFDTVSKYTTDTRKSFIERSEAYYNCLVEVIDSMENLPLQVLCNSLVHSTNFLSYPASIDKHHNYPGGLLVHTSQTVNTILNMQGESQAFDPDAAIVAAVFHDAGKLEEYTLVKGPKVKNPFKKTEWGQINGHVSASAIIFRQKAPGGTDTLRSIEHAILSHHGRPEWGSLTPKTSLAWALHLSDMASVFTFKSEYKEIAKKKKSSSKTR